jgi:predicted nucleic acid-binding protein
VLTSVDERDAVQVARAVEMLLNHKYLMLQDPEMVTAAPATLRQRPTLGFSDCLLVELARKAGHLQFGTVDRNLGKVDGAEKQ